MVAEQCRWLDSALLSFDRDELAELLEDAGLTQAEQTALLVELDGDAMAALDESSGEWRSVLQVAASKARKILHPWFGWIEVYREEVRRGRKRR